MKRETIQLLRGWKEIAEYMHVSRKTAQGWAREGMPVTKSPGGRPAAVWADPRALDRWLGRRLHVSRASGVRLRMLAP